LNIALSIVASLSSLIGLQAGMDMAVLEKWSSARLVKYRVEGVHNARVPVVFGDYEGKADVIDRVVVEFTWDVGKQQVVGPVAITDGKSELKNIKSDDTNCPPPKLNGEYEHFKSGSSSMTSPDQIQITGTRTYPAAMVSNYPGSCSMRSIPGSQEQKLIWVAGLGPEVLGMPIMKESPVAVSADRKTFSVKGAENWVWTYSPTRL
jgi:hypothetical protein